MRASVDTESLLDGQSLIIQPDYSLVFAGSKCYHTQHHYYFFHTGRNHSHALFFSIGVKRCLIVKSIKIGKQDGIKATHTNTICFAKKTLLWYSSGLYCRASLLQWIKPSVVWSLVFQTQKNDLKIVQKLKCCHTYIVIQVGLTVYNVF